MHSPDQDKKNYRGVFLQAAKSCNTVIVQELSSFVFFLNGLFAKD